MSEAPNLTAGDSDLRRVATLANELVEAEQAVTDMEAALKEAKRVAFDLAVNKLPDAMNQAGLAELLTSTGRKIGLKSVVAATWPGEDKPDKLAAAMLFLTAEEALDLVSSEVTVAFSRTDHERAQELYDQLRGNNAATVKIKQTVHPSRLSAWVRDRLTNGKRVDMDALSVHSFIRATVK